MITDPPPEEDDMPVFPRSIWILVGFVIGNFAVIGLLLWK